MGERAKVALNDSQKPLICVHIQAPSRYKTYSRIIFFKTCSPPTGSRVATMTGTNNLTATAPRSCLNNGGVEHGPLWLVGGSQGDPRLFIGLCPAGLHRWNPGHQALASVPLIWARLQSGAPVTSVQMREQWFHWFYSTWIALGDPTRGMKPLTVLFQASLGHSNPSIMVRWQPRKGTVYTIELN